ncbi:MAG TPA: recombination-associated protein RdgC [Labilithrix sp.]|nr:recombination-associated protein RdgC [Labilithrix sp.]
MPALRGSLTYARFFVDGDVPEDFREKFMRAIRLRAMKPLEADDADLERSGWCKVGEPFEIELRYEDVFYNEYVNLGLRTDKWRLPASMLKQRLREAEAAYLEKKGRERLGRAEKTELKEMVARKLRKQTSPATRMIDLSWSMNEGVVRFFSHAEKAGAQMMELFTKTFGLRLVPEAPYTLAARLGLSKAQESAWQELEVTMLEKEQA